MVAGINTHNGGYNDRVIDRPVLPPSIIDAGDSDFLLLIPVSLIKDQLTKFIEHRLRDDIDRQNYPLLIQKPREIWQTPRGWIS